MSMEIELPVVPAMTKQKASQSLLNDSKPQNFLSEDLCPHIISDKHTVQDQKWRNSNSPLIGFMGKKVHKLSFTDNRKISQTGFMGKYY